MTIIRKELIHPFLQELDRYYTELRRAVEGKEPSGNLSHSYHCEANQFVREYTDVDLERVGDCVGHFKISVEAVKRIKKLAAKRVGS